RRARCPHCGEVFQVPQVAKTDEDGRTVPTNAAGATPVTVSVDSSDQQAAPDGPALTHNESVQRLREELSLRWRQADRVSVERLLQEHPELRLDADAVLDLVFSEILLRQGLGEFAVLEEYQRRFPELGPAIERQFLVHRLLAPDSLFRTNEAP